MSSHASPSVTLPSPQNGIVVSFAVILYLPAELDAPSTKRKYSFPEIMLCWNSSLPPAPVVSAQRTWLASSAHVVRM